MYIQAHSGIIQAYSELCVTLTYSVPPYFQNPVKNLHSISIRYIRPVFLCYVYFIFFFPGIRDTVNVYLAIVNFLLMCILFCYCVAVLIEKKIRYIQYSKA